MTTIKTQMLAFCTPVHTLLTEQGVSTVAVLNKINAALGQMTHKPSDDKESSLSAMALKNESARQKENLGILAFESKRNTPLDFKGFNDSIAKIAKVFPSFELGSFPVQFREWLETSKKPSEKSPEVDKAEAKAAIEATKEIVAKRNGKVPVAA